jgi:hypothetical protein
MSIEGADGGMQAQGRQWKTSQAALSTFLNGLPQPRNVTHIDLIHRL